MGEFADEDEEGAAEPIIADESAVEKDPLPKKKANG